ncbi:DNA damage-inducible protein D [Parasutterella excrementihominis]|uniref:DNA damage-inducible protein D n=1 Tax=Parasutterella excrementihominis TaxID=487175 RepID=UPI003AB8BD0F
MAEELTVDVANADFDEIKQFDEERREFWYARDLWKLLGYSSWQKFEPVIKKAVTACRTAGIPVGDHFNLVDKMVSLGSNAERSIKDIALSRYACYLIVQNGDPSTPIIAMGQTYFAIQTRRQELSDQEKFEALSDEEKRVHLRHQLSDHNKHLSSAAHDAGITEPKDYAIFQNHGYRGLYGGLGQQDIHKRKKLKQSQKILDYMDYEELAANLFRATQTEAKLRRENITGKENANRTHYEVGAAVRKTIKDLGGTMPEDLPTPSKSVKALERELEKKKKISNK